MNILKSKYSILCLLISFSCVSELKAQSIQFAMQIIPEGQTPILQYGSGKAQDFIDALQKLNGRRGRLVVTASTWTIDKSLLMPSSVDVELQGSSRLNIMTGAKLEIFGKLTVAPLTRAVFIGDGQVSLLPSKNLILYSDWFGSKPNDPGPDSTNIQKAINNLNMGQTLQFSEGVYIFDKTVFLDSKSQITLAGGLKTSIQKMLNITFQYLFVAYENDKLIFSNLEFQGRSFDSQKINWGDDGIALFSTKNSSVINCYFKHFGDSAIRMATRTGMVGETQSFNNFILNNKFENITQVTTNNPGTGKNEGGSNDLTVEGNTFLNLKGALKITSRAPMSGAFIRKNIFRKSLNNAIELSSASKVFIESNEFYEISGSVVAAFSNNAALPGFDWGRITFIKNKIYNSNIGISMYVNAYADQSDFTFNDLDVRYNEFHNLYSATHSAIYLSGNSKKGYNGISIQQNKFINNKIQNPIRMPAVYKNSTIQNNITTSLLNNNS